MKTAAAYIRVSTDDQLEYSPDSQLEAIKSFAARNGFYLPKENVFVDEGISGRKAEKRPAFMQMIAYAKTKPKPFDAIIVWKFSRFARSREDSIVYKSMLKKQCKIDVISVSEQLSEDKTSILIEALLEAMDEYYSINLAEEVKRGMTEKAKRGEPQTIPPYGYKMREKQFYINEEEAKYVHMIFDDFLKGDGFLQIAKKLNTLGCRTHRGNLFENRTIEYILRNPVYIGKLRWNPAHRTRRNYEDENIMITDASHEPIIKEEQFELVQEKIAKQKSKYKYIKPVDPLTTKTWLKGIVRCKECDSAMVVTSSTGSLQCNGYAHGRCFSHSVKIEKLEAAVLNYMKAVAESGNVENFVSYSKNSKAETDYNALIKSAEQKLQRIKNAYQAGIDTLEEYKENKTRIDAEINQIKKEAAAAAKKTPNMKNFKNTLLNTCMTLENPDVSIAEKNKTAKDILHSVHFSNPSKKVYVTFFIEL